jgi:hypothetical protein
MNPETQQRNAIEVAWATHARTTAAAARAGLATRRLRRLVRGDRGDQVADPSAPSAHRCRGGENVPRRDSKAGRRALIHKDFVLPSTPSGG